MKDFFFDPSMIPLHKKVAERWVQNDEDISKLYDKMIQQSQNLIPSDAVTKVYNFYKSKTCKLCGNTTLDSAYNFFYHTFSKNHKKRALPNVSDNDLLFWGKIMAGCKSLKPLSKKACEKKTKNVERMSNILETEVMSPPTQIIKYYLYDRCDDCSNSRANHSNILDEREIIRLESLYLEDLFKNVDKDKLNNFMPLNKVVCESCNVESTNAFEYIKHLVSKMHRIYVQSSKVCSHVQFISFWEDILFKCRCG